MADTPLDTLMRHVRGLAAGQSGKDRTDGELLRAFSSLGDQDAFTLLTRRHGPLVLAVCRRVLRQLEDAEDAFQASFILLARQAAALARRESVAGWLHGVAFRLASNARRAVQRRRRHERQSPMTTPANPAWQAAWREVQLLLDEEIQRLPEKYRAPFILCCLEGHSSSAAARQLRLKEGTVWSRLAEARKRLHQRLDRRGVALTAVLGAGALSPSPAVASLPAALAGKAVAAALAATGRSSLGATVISESVAALVKGMTRSLLVKKTALGLVLLLATSALVGVAGSGALESREGTSAHAAEKGGTKRAATAVPKPAVPEAVPAAPFASRQLDNRQKMLRDYGGTAASEAAVAAGLQWLARHQDASGTWLLEDPRFPDKGKENDVAGAAFGLLPYLGAGYTHKPAAGNPYAKVIEKALAFLIQKQDKRTGNLGGGMYAHGLAAAALCEAYGMTQDPALRRPAQAAIDYIVNAQHEAGGWRYAPGMAGDTSVFGFQLRAVLTARMARLEVPDLTIKKAEKFLDSVRGDDEGYRYLPENPASTPTLTAIGLLARQQFQGWTLENPRLAKGIENQLANKGPDLKDMYYSFYATQVMFHAGGALWKNWNDKMREDVIAAMDRSAGPLNGSWGSNGASVQMAVGGRMMQTSLCLLTLEVYYRCPRVVGVKKGTDARDQSGKTATDLYGDPLPEGVVARLGGDRFRHEGGAPLLAYTSADKYLVARTLYEVWIWDAATGKALHRWRASGYPSLAMAVSADGSTLATDETMPGDKNATISLREVGSGKKVRTLAVPRGEDRELFFTDLHFTTDGRSLAGAYLGKVIVFDLGSGQVRLKVAVQEHVSDFRFAISPDSKTLAAVRRPSEAAGDDAKRSLALWDLATGKLLRTFVDLPNEIDRDLVAFAPDGDMLALSVRNRILLFDPATGKELRRLETKMWDQRSLAFTSDGKKLVYGGNEGAAIVWELTSGKTLRSFEGRMKVGGYVAISHDSKALALGTSGTTVQFWDLETGQERFTEYHSHHSPIAALAFSPDGKTLASGGELEQGQTFLWDLRQGQRSRMFDGSCRRLAFSPEGKSLAVTATSGRDGTNSRVRVWDVSANKETLLIRVPDATSILSAVFSPDGRKLFTLDQNQSDLYHCCLRHWDVASGQEECFKTIPRDLLPEGVATDGKTVWATVRLGGMKVYDAESGRERFRRGKYQHWEQMSLSPDTWLLASWVSDIRLWEIATGKEIFHLKGHEFPVGVVAWSSDARMLASADRWPNRARTVRLWDTATGKQVALFHSPRADVTAMTFSPDATLLACGLGDGTILVLDVRAAVSKLARPEAGKDTLESCYSDLGAGNPARAHPAIATLVAAAKQSVSFLQDRLMPVKTADPEKIQQWIAALDSDKFAVRQAAAKELEKVGAQVEIPLRKALEGKITLEARQRLQQILKDVAEVSDPDTLRTIRAIMALERIASPEARTIVASLARGATGARETEEAKAALERLNQRVSKAP
jgi:RNA polymerase sigma factor (sigma-70 family)